MKKSPLDHIADADLPSETTPDGEQQINLSKSTHRGEDRAKKVYERETGEDFCY